MYGQKGTAYRSAARYAADGKIISAKLISPIALELHRAFLFHVKPGVRYRGVRFVLAYGSARRGMA